MRYYKTAETGLPAGEKDDQRLQGELRAAELKRSVKKCVDYKILTIHDKRGGYLNIGSGDSRLGGEDENEQSLTPLMRLS